MATLQTELAKEGIPLPFGNRFWASNWPTGKGPLPGLVLHLIPSVSIQSRSPVGEHAGPNRERKVIVIIGLPMNVAYPFILDVQGYPSQIINLLVVVVCRLPSSRIPFCGYNVRFA